MPGTPKWHELLKQVEIAGGWQSVMDAIADGASLRMLAKKFNVSRGWFWRVITNEPERRKLYEEALRLRGDAMAEEALEIVDGPIPATPAEAQQMKLRVELRQWLAAVDTARYRRVNGASVQVNIGALHLDALRWQPPAQIEASDVEIVQELPAGPGDTQS
jgi:terminase small subunit-like protein